MSLPPTERSIERIVKLVDSYTSKTATTTHPNREVTQGVVLGLAIHLDKLKRPLCPCRFYPDKTEEIKHRTWICPCDDMQIYKYCHCLLFVRRDGLPVTEHLPADHEAGEFGVTWPIRHATRADLSGTRPWTGKMSAKDVRLNSCWGAIEVV